MADHRRRITVWNEFIHERTKTEVKELYPEGIHETLRRALIERLGSSVQVECATLDLPEHGLSDEVLESTDVLLWWGHAAHDQVDDAIVAKVHKRVLAGMGLIVLHSGHASKIFQKLMGTSCMLRWRDAGELERLWIVSPGHPIMAGIDKPFFELPAGEMYGEHFDIPEPDELLLISCSKAAKCFEAVVRSDADRGVSSTSVLAMKHFPSITTQTSNALSRMQSNGLYLCLTEPMILMADTSRFL